MPPTLPRKPSILARQEIARSRLFAIERLELRFANGAERTFERLKSSARVRRQAPAPEETVERPRENADR